MSETDAPPAPPKKQTLKERLTALFETYGNLALVVWFTLGITTFGTLYLAISAGADLSGLVDWSVAQGCSTPEQAAHSGTVAVACIGCQATKPARIALTVLLVPIVARMRKPPAPPTTAA